MTILAHCAAGVLVGKVFESVPMGQPLAFVSGVLTHYIMDGFGHYEWLLPFKNPRADMEKSISRVPKALLISVFVEVSVIALAVYLQFRSLGVGEALRSPILWGAIGACLPDLLDNVPFWSARLHKLRIFNLENKFHEEIHYRSKVTPVYGMASTMFQIVLILLAGWLIS